MDRNINEKTFFRVQEKVRTNAMRQAQWLEFLHQLEKINSRDALIAKIALQGGSVLAKYAN